MTIVGLTKEELAKVKTFVASEGDRMDYTVAVDLTGELHDAYMKAFEQRGIPHAFIVDQKGQIAWHGHPAAMDEVLERVVSGGFDGMAYEQRRNEEQAKAEQDRKDQLTAVRKHLAENKDDVDALLAYAALLSHNRTDPAEVTRTIARAYALDPAKCETAEDPMIQQRLPLVRIEAEAARLSAALEKDPDNIPLLLKRAETYLGDSFVTELRYYPDTLHSAIADYERVVELDPADEYQAAEQVQFFKAFLTRGDPRTEALSTFCSEHPESIRKPFALFMLYFDADQKGDKESAIRYLEEANQAHLDSLFGKRVAGMLKQLQDTPKP